jgi:chemotaxis protein CheC
MKEFSDIEMDALKEFVNVGTANAATALSKLIDRTISVSVPRLKIVPIGDVPSYLGGPEKQITGLYFKIYGGITGSVLLFLPQESSKALVDILTAQLSMESPEEFDSIKRSAIMELGNILTNSFLNAMADMVGENLFLSVPYYSEDYLGAVIDLLLIEIAQVAEYALLMDTIIKAPNSELAGNFIIFPEAESLEKIFKRMGLE